MTGGISVSGVCVLIVVCVLRLFVFLSLSLGIVFVADDNGNAGQHHCKHENSGSYADDDFLFLTQVVSSFLT